MSKYEEKIGYGRAILQIIIDEKVKNAIKKQAKRHGMIMAKYIQKILQKAIEEEK